MIAEIFRKDRKYWTTEQQQRVDQFLLCNEFYSKFYQKKHFEKIISFSFYTKIESKQEYFLEYNKKSQIVILLAGKVEVYRKISVNEKIKKKKKNLQNIEEQNRINKSSLENKYEGYIHIGQFQKENQTIILKSDTIIFNLNDKIAEILFIPSSLYQVHENNISEERIHLILDALCRVFRESTKKELRPMAESNCNFFEYRMHHYIYRAGSIPDTVYILLEGNIKLQIPGFSAKKIFEMSIISPEVLFGEKDILAESRLQNAICCSAHVALLSIPKQVYLKFLKGESPKKPYEQLYSHRQKINEIKSQQSIQKMNNSHGQEIFLPKIHRFHSFSKPEIDKKVQQRLVKNCHLLINLSPKKKNKSMFRSPESHEKDYTVNQFTEKFKFFQKMRPDNSQLDLTNKFF